MRTKPKMSLATADREGRKALKNHVKDREEEKLFPDCPNCGKKQTKCKCRPSEKAAASEEAPPEEEQGNGNGEGKTKRIKYGTRLATAEERIELNKKGLCWLVRDYGDGTVKPCPNQRVQDKEFCHHHAGTTDPASISRPVNQDQEIETMATKKSKSKKSAEKAEPKAKATKATKKAAAKENGNGKKCDVCKKVKKTTRGTSDGTTICGYCYLLKLRGKKRSRS